MGFRVLLVASYFRKKFAGILSEKEILGSKHVNYFFMKPHFFTCSIVFICFSDKLIWMVARCYQKGGLVEMYAVSQMPLSKHQSRVIWFFFWIVLFLLYFSFICLYSFFLQPGVFMEFCKHDSCGCGCEPYIDNLTLVHQAVI